nr:immunoglobulin light chain junction region [Macaca mulatta]MOV62216.1 immunoglobulin light chain junction region [Macaca mulatta]MOV62300.1 immunoglobulin light chain junction region [Macaca mulatta]MOV62353.1 immunoglobulin light chain junction region [Macaca mulatta]MOV63176.1 immunoglobulin light chain junction region [Macaca mulatta]
CMQGLEFPPSF